MAQTTNYEIANSSGLVFRGRVNEVFAAVQSNNSGATEPTGTVAYQLWYDTTTNILKMRNASNSAWINLFTLDQTNSVWSVNANSTSDALRITQTGTGNALLVEDSANPDSTPFVITAAGDVGIGTTTPTNTLTVNGTIGGTIVATQAEAEAGTDNTKLITPLRVAQAIGGKTITTPISGSPLNTQTFNASGTWTKPASGTFAVVELWGAGGSGAANNNSSSSSGGGGGGAYKLQIFTLAELPSTVTVTVGAGGVARTAGSDSDGAVGGNTTFGAFATAFGGGGGNVGLSTFSTIGGGGGGGSSVGTTLAGGANINPKLTTPNSVLLRSGDLFLRALQPTVWVSSEGGNPNSVSSEDKASTYGGGAGGGSGAGPVTYAGGNSVWGGGGGGGASVGTSALGGTSVYGGAGGRGGHTAASVAGTQPAGGGGAGYNVASGAGGDGRVIVTVY